jgi:AcrR family transcriptional regulator
MKEKILAKATEMFLNAGFKNVTMDDVANNMKVSVKIITSHFENKTELVEASAMLLFNLIKDGIQQIRSQEKEAIEELFEIKNLMLVSLKNQNSSPQYQLQQYYPIIHKKLVGKQFEVLHECLVHNVTRGIKNNTYRKDIAPEFASRIYFSGLANIKDKSIFPVDEFPMTTLMSSHLEHFIGGLVTPKGREILDATINSNKNSTKEVVI